MALCSRGCACGFHARARRSPGPRRCACAARRTWRAARGAQPAMRPRSTCRGRRRQSTLRRQTSICAAKEALRAHTLLRRARVTLVLNTLLIILSQAAPRPVACFFRDHGCDLVRSLSLRLPLSSGVRGAGDSGCRAMRCAIRMRPRYIRTPYHVSNEMTTRHCHAHPMTI